MLRIGEFSVLAKTTVKALRFYDEIDLFKPSFVDDNGYRYYDVDSLNVLQKIIELRNLNMPLEEIKKVISGHNLIEIFNKRLAELENNLKTDKQNIELLKKYMAKAKKGEFMISYKTKQIMLPKCVVYYREGVIDTMAELVPFILEAGEEVRKNNPTLKCAEPEYCFVCYGANEYKEKDVEVMYAEAVEKFGKESKNIKFKQIEEVKAISVTHKGSYADLGKAYAYAISFVKQNGYEITEQIRERYIHGCWDTKDENDYVTEIQIPIK